MMSWLDPLVYFIGWTIFVLGGVTAFLWIVMFFLNRIWRAWKLGRFFSVYVKTISKEDKEKLYS